MSVDAKIAAILEKNKILSPGDRAQMEKQAKAMLERLDPIDGVALEHRDLLGLMVDLVEEAYRSAASLHVGRPDLGPGGVQLAHKSVGQAPGAYEIWVVWDAGQTRVFYTGVYTGSLRHSAADDSIEG